MQSFQGYFEAGQFIPLDAVKIPERRRVILTVLDEPVPTGANVQTAAWKVFFAAVKGSDEVVPETFDRVGFSREVEI